MQRKSNFRGIAICLSTMAILAMPLWLGACGQRDYGSKQTKKSDASTLRIWHTEVDAAAVKELETIIENFKKEHPAVNVVQEAIPWNDLNERLVRALAMGDVPDLVHLQPFMTKSLYRHGNLVPIDDVITAIGETDIFPAVRDLQKFDGHYYGIAYAVGATFFAVRKDMMAVAGVPTPSDWDEFLTLAKILTIDENHDGVIERYGVALPGEPFFIDQFTVELIASNGGGIYDENDWPNFKDHRVAEALKFWKELSACAPPDWTSQKYLNQFIDFANGKVSMVPVFYTRALKNLEQSAGNSALGTDRYGFIPQPTGPSGKSGYATMDCENWSILEGSKNVTLAKEFLKYFYKPENYLRYCLSVPIHLTPVLASVANDQKYLGNEMITRWRPWQEETNRRLASNEALPILFTKVSDRNIPYLMQLQGDRIITDMVVSVCRGEATIEEATDLAQTKAERLLRRLGYEPNGLTQ